MFKKRNINTAIPLHAKALEYPCGNLYEVRDYNKIKEIQKELNEIKKTNKENKNKKV
jgi:hypothetical protein